ncbi:MAG: hypothetical protein ABGY42_00105, partial [bacterium]
QPPECALTAGVCAGAAPVCGGESGWVPCTQFQYGDDYEQAETTCDCLDNDCDGELDEDEPAREDMERAGEEGPIPRMACPLEDLVQGPDQVCVVGVSSTVPPGEYLFDTLAIAEGIRVDTINDGAAGFGHTTPEGGGGSFVLRAARLRLAGPDAHAGER